MKLSYGLAAAGVVVVGIGLALTFQAPWASVPVQRGYRGTGMEQIINKNEQALKEYASVLPPAEPAADLTGVLRRRCIRTSRFWATSTLPN